MPFQPHPEYKKYAMQWQRCRDTTEGEDAVKSRGTLYLPMLEGRKEDRTKNAGYEAYKERASFYGATGRTVLGLTGAVMRNPAVVEGTPAIALEDDDVVLTDVRVGFAGETVGAMIHRTVSQVLEVGRIGHLVDALPAEKTDGPLRPYVVEYVAEDILTWHEEVVAGTKSVVLVVLREFVTKPSADPKKNLAIESSIQYRVLRMVTEMPASEDSDELFRPTDFDDGAIYIQEIWIDKNDEKGTSDEMILVSRVVPRSQVGSPFDAIPFTFTNWDGSSPSVSKPPLIDLASINISHWRNSADMEHGLHYTAMPTPWAAGFELQGKTLEIGSRTAWISDDPNAKVGMLEFSGAGLGLLQTKMISKEGLMAVLGARFLEESRPGVEAAETVKLRQSGDRSVLAGITQSISNSWTRILTTMWEWVNVTTPKEAISVTLNTDFSSSQMTPQMLMSMISALQTGAISWPTFVENLQRGEVISNSITPETEAERVLAGAPSIGLGSTSNDQPFPGA